MARHLGGVTVQSIGRARPNGDEIAFLFRDAKNIVTFHTTFIYNKTTDAWRWLMDNEESGKYRSYARVTLTRK